MSKSNKESNASQTSLQKFFSLDKISREKIAKIARTKEFKALKEKLSEELPAVPITKSFLEMIIKQLCDLLKIDVYAVLLCAWNKSGDILKYSNSKRYPPKATFVVPLAEHTVTSEHKPSLQLTLNKMPLGEIELDVRLALHLKGVLLNIKKGRVMAITLGSCKGEGSVKSL